MALALQTLDCARACSPQPPTTPSTNGTGAPGGPDGPCGEVCVADLECTVDTPCGGALECMARAATQQHCSSITECTGLCVSEEQVQFAVEAVEFCTGDCGFAATVCPYACGMLRDSCLAGDECAGALTCFDGKMKDALAQNLTGNDLELATFDAINVCKTFGFCLNSDSVFIIQRCYMSF